MKWPLTGALIIDRPAVRGAASLERSSDRKDQEEEEEEDEG